MTRLARAFARRPMLLLRQDFGVSRPEVRVEQAHLDGLGRLWMIKTGALKLG